MQKLNRIQKRNNLNEVFSVDDVHAINNGHHVYAIKLKNPKPSTELKIDDAFLEPTIYIRFQNGARCEPESVSGILDTDLLEIVRDRLESFQRGKYANECNAEAKKHIEQALLYLTWRTEERFEENKLGTNKV